jgi:hypothetical protein
MTIDGFSVEPHTTIDTFLFWRMAEPWHEYIIKIVSGHIERSSSCPLPSTMETQK